MFDIDKTSKIFFYGYSQFELVKDKYFMMSSMGYHVAGYIDKRAPEIKGEWPCWTMREFVEKEKNSSEDVIIFLLQNGFLHEPLASCLRSKGFQKILFLPLHADTDEKKEMFKKYNLFLEEEYESLTNIPEADAVLERPENIRQQVRAGKKRDIYFVPTEMLFSYNPAGDYDNENIKFCLPYVELYDFLTGKTEFCRRYLKFMGKENGEQFLEDRKRMFLNYEYELQFGMDFFVETAAYAIWNEKGYFNIFDGHHRAVYLAYKGYRQIPVRIEKKDFVMWENREQAQKIQGLREIPCPIPVPFFLNHKIVFERRLLLC